MRNKLRRFVISVSIATPLLLGIGDIGVSAACAANLPTAVHARIFGNGKTC